MTTEQQAAQNLIDQAMQSNDSALSYLLIDSAYRLDNSVNVEAHKSAWIDKWMKSEYTKRGIS